MNCKPGDLAYLSSDCVDEGVIVEVLRAGLIVGVDSPTWHCKSRTPIYCTMQRSGKEVWTTEICVEDRYLRPISGIPINDEVTDDITEPA
ncbi:hypothetical protein J2801_003600 [Paraburkholderia phenoliruptrix]|uniref:hypothetical protein n=1 Tax=Paraburkholderia phenoliruptrix TaxID=252970 RepID=UPI002861BA0D|nr:hypothetical protein [Paraburkholderia phenoliruptrix]MDR6421312.1 hypothetical protein [Paraburkholderia phenoliruptrix]